MMKLDKLRGGSLLVSVVAVAAILTFVFSGCSSDKPAESWPTPSQSGAGGTGGTTTDDHTTNESSGGGSSSGTADSALLGPCPDGQRLGRFSIVVDAAYSSVVGEIRDAVVWGPAREVVAEQGQCTLDRPADSPCDPPCTGGSMCTPEGDCVPYPLLVAAGTISIHGLDDAVEMEPVGEGSYFATNLVHPVFRVQRSVGLQAAGAGVESFHVDARSFEPLDLGAHETWTAQASESMFIGWEPVPMGGQQIHASLSIDTHGEAPLRLTCVLEDTGEFVVPKELMASLVEGGVSGLALAQLARATTNHVETSVGCVELELAARTTPRVQVP